MMYVAFQTSLFEQHGIKISEVSFLRADFGEGPSEVRIRLRP